MDFWDNLVICYLVIVGMLVLLAICNGIGLFIVKLRDRDLKRKQGYLRRVL